MTRNEPPRWSSRTFVPFVLAVLGAACVALCTSVFADPPQPAESPKIVVADAPQPEDPFDYLVVARRLSWPRDAIKKNEELAADVERHLAQGELGRAAEARRAQEMFAMQTDISLLQKECQRLARELERVKAELAAQRPALNVIPN
jgi:hypothetical protein